MIKNNLNKNQIQSLDKRYIDSLVKIALKEDLNFTGDITAKLVQDINIHAYCITREDMILCGIDFINQIIEQVDKNIQIECYFNDSDNVSSNQRLFELYGNARSILTLERTALNFLQMLSGTATQTFKFQSLIKNYKTKLLDTRKTIPGFRLAQKYAVICGGGFNHRIGLFDAYLIKENHIHSAGGMKQAILKARAFNIGTAIEVEVANIDELEQAISLKADIIMLDNFTIQDIQKAVNISKNNVLLEVSGNVDEKSLIDIAKTNVDFISSGSITKNIKAIDLSMQVQI